MSGGYINCGSFLGNDKSGSAISGVIDALSDFVPVSDRQSFSETVIRPLQDALNGDDDHVLIERDMAERLIPALEAFHNSTLR